MNIIVAGKNDIAVDILKEIKKLSNINCFVVLNRNENFKNSFQKSLGFFAKLWGVKILKLEDVYKMNDVIFLSLEFDRIINTNLFKTKYLYNIHFSYLPSYKGMYTSAHPILNGEKKSGVTLHLIDNGIDTGDIIDQISFKLSIDETAKSLYLKYIEKGTLLVKKNLNNLINQNISPFRQKIKNSSYFSKDSIDYKNLKINLLQTSFQIDKSLRAYYFREFQLPKINNLNIGKWKISQKRSKYKAGNLKKINEFKYILSTIDYDIYLWEDPYEYFWESCKTNDLNELKKIIGLTNLDLEQKNNQGQTALLIGIINSSFDCIKFLIENGANCNAYDYNKKSALMYAVLVVKESREFEILEILINNNANKHSIDLFGTNVFDLVESKDNEMYKFLKNDKILRP